jgi:hypothetical protein
MAVRVDMMLLMDDFVEGFLLGGAGRLYLDNLEVDE